MSIQLCMYTCLHVLECQEHQVKLPAQHTISKPVRSQEHQVKLPAQAKRCTKEQMLEGQRVCIRSRQTHWSHFWHRCLTFSISLPWTENRNVISGVVCRQLGLMFLAQNWPAFCAMCWQLDLMFLAQNWLVSCVMCWQLDPELYIPTDGK